MVVISVLLDPGKLRIGLAMLSSVASAVTAGIEPAGRGKKI